MTKLGPNEKLYPVVKIAMVVEALRNEGVAPKEALAGIQISEGQLASPAVRVSANQVMQSYRNAIRLQPGFADARANYGRWLMAHSRFAEAEICLAEALR